MAGCTHFNSLRPVCPQGDACHVAVRSTLIIEVTGLFIPPIQDDTIPPSYETPLAIGAGGRALSLYLKTLACL